MEIAALVPGLVLDPYLYRRSWGMLAWSQEQGMFTAQGRNKEQERTLSKGCGGSSS